jgi:hypothetical protein
MFQENKVCYVVIRQARTGIRKWNVTHIELFCNLAHLQMKTAVHFSYPSVEKGFL